MRPRSKTTRELERAIGDLRAAGHDVHYSL
jgi:hypothetical protein